MKPFETKDYKAFTMFEERWALVTAGTLDVFNTCTVSWGSMGNVWGPNGGDMSTVTVYIHPARYTQEFMAKHDTFTVSFFPESLRKALGYLGSHSGRDEEEISRFGFDGTPRPIDRGAFLRRPVVKDSRNKEFYDIADAVYYEVYKEHFDETVVK